jgi:hypothetical protein
MEGKVTRSGQACMARSSLKEVGMTMKDQPRYTLTQVLRHAVLTILVDC